MEKIEIDYHELCDLIVKGLLRHDKDTFIGMALMQGKIGTYNQDEWDERIQRWLTSQLAHNVVMSLKEKFGDQLIITEESQEVFK